MTSAFYGFRMLVVAIIAPLAVTVAAVVVQLLLAARAPGLVATHWGVGGAPDGYGSPFTYPLLMSAISVALIAGLGGAIVIASHHGPLTRVMKLLGVTSLWVTIFLAFVLSWPLIAQRSGADVHHVAGPGLAIVAGLGVAFLVAVGAWYVMPKAVGAPGQTSESSIAPVVLADGERASWIRTAAASRGILFVFVGIGVLLGGVEILVVLLTNGRLWWFAIVPVAALLILLSNLAWTVRVDGRGVRLRSVLGVPAITIALDNVASADVVEVSAFSQYGGWGIRWNLAGRVGIILRSGEALEIQRKKGLVVVVTVDDAKTAAALINGLVQRQASVI